MKIRLTGTSFRKSQVEIPVGTELDLRPDPNGSATGQKHTDPHALSVWFADTFIGYIPKGMNQNKFDTVRVSEIWYKKDQGGLCEYSPGAFIAGLEVECEGDFQINSDEGRTYEQNGLSYTSITEFLKDYPSKPDGLIFWAMGQVQDYLAENSVIKSLFNERGFLHSIYENALNKTAEDGTDLHQLIEDYLKARMEYQEPHEGSMLTRSNLEKAWASLPKNVQRFFDKLGEFEVVDLEFRVYDDELGLAGTCDALLRVNGTLMPFDWKSSKKVQNKHKVQVGFYGKNKGAKVGAIICFGAENKQGFSVSKVDIDKAYEILQYMKALKELEKQLTYKK